MQKKKPAAPRLNIYLPDPSVRRRIKAAATEQDISASEYCVRAILAHLEQEQQTVSPEQERAQRLRSAVEQARRFREATFQDQVFSVSSAELIREVRENEEVR
ncbi:hypothetical protein BH23GEM3_BH23GEM3_14650 [soil metagenome]|jgi:hypothetical protein|nr:hypothetical protein [Gemmatimonadota bacterium]